MKNAHCPEILSLVLNSFIKCIWELPPFEEGVSLCCCVALRKVKAFGPFQNCRHRERGWMCTGVPAVRCSGSSCSFTSCVGPASMPTSPVTMVTHPKDSPFSSTPPTGCALRLQPAVLRYQMIGARHGTGAKSGQSPSFETFLSASESQCRNDLKAGSLLIP